MKTTLVTLGVLAAVYTVLEGPTRAQSPAARPPAAAAPIAARALVDVKIPALNGSPGIPAATVFLKDGRIESIRATTAADRRLPDVVSYAGATLLPGLV